jgi:hypothetical protein
MDESTTSLDLVKIEERGAQSLRLVVAEMSVGHGLQGRTLELVWEKYAVYTVINESYDNGNGADVFEGHRFRLYSQSRYLRFVEESIENVVFLHPGYKHWGVICEDHIVHVISNCEPQISLL